jgi:hypothetical protein
VRRSPKTYKPMQEAAVVAEIWHVMNAEASGRKLPKPGNLDAAETIRRVTR